MRQKTSEQCRLLAQSRPTASPRCVSYKAHPSDRTVARSPANGNQEAPLSRAGLFIFTATFLGVREFQPAPLSPNRSQRPPSPYKEHSMSNNVR